MMGGAAWRATRFRGRLLAPVCLFAILGGGLFVPLACRSQGLGCGLSKPSDSLLATVQPTDGGGWRVGENPAGVTNAGTAVVTEGAGTVAVREASTGAADWAVVGYSTEVSHSRVTVRTEKGIAVLDAMTGRVLHCLPLANLGFTSTHVVLGDTSALVTDGLNVSVYDVASGKLNWSTAEANLGAWQISGERIIGLSDERWVAFDAHTGDQAWSWDQPKDSVRPLPNQIAIVDDHLIVATNGKLMALAVSDGSVRWSSPFIGAIVGTNDRTVVVQNDGGSTPDTLSAVDARTGDIVSTMPGAASSDRPSEPIVVADDGRVLTADLKSVGMITTLRLQELRFDFATAAGTVFGSEGEAPLTEVVPLTAVG